MLKKNRLALRYLWLPTLMVVLLMLARPTEAATVHMRYFESFDVYLTEQRFQVFSFAPLEGEIVTIVAYGINQDDGIIPALTVLGADGVTLSEDFNPDGKSLAYAQFTASQSGMYTFLVSRLSDANGLVRVMLFKDKPIDYDVTLLDFADPLLPSRAFLIAGNSLDPIGVHTEVIPPEDPNQPTPEYYVSRGDTLTLPPIKERFTPVQQFNWSNDNGDTFYTINIRPIPEVTQPTAFKAGLFSLPNRQAFLNAFNYFLTIGDGSEPVRVDRQECQTMPGGSLTLFSGPGENFNQVGAVGLGQSVEVVGTDKTGEWLQIVDENQPNGASWLPRGGIVIQRDVCGRVVQVFQPGSPDEAQQIFDNVTSHFPTGNPPGNPPKKDPPNNPPNNPTGNPTLNPTNGGGVIIVPPPTGCTGVNTVVLAAAVSNFVGTICDDHVTGNTLGNVITGDLGNDTLSGRTGNDTMDAGPGIDWIDESFGTNSMEINLGIGSTFGADVDFDSLSGFENAASGSGNDILVGDGGPNHLISNAGSDNLNGGAGNDTLEGGTDPDSLYGGAGNDTLLYQDGDEFINTDDPDTDFIDGGAGNDTLNFSDATPYVNDVVTGGAGNNLFLFGAISGMLEVVSGGNDTLDFTGFGVPIDLDMSDTTTFQDISGTGCALSVCLKLTGFFEAIFGTGGSDTITGNSVGNFIDAGDGNNNVTGGSGTDTIRSGSGNDTITGGTGADTIHSGAGNDSINAGDGPDLVFGEAGDDTINGSLGTDTLFGDSDNSAGGCAGSGSDFVTDSGNSNNDQLYGGSLNTSGTCDDGGDSLFDPSGSGDLIVGGNRNSGTGIGSDGNDTILLSDSGSSKVYGGNDNSGFGSGHDDTDTITVTSRGNNTIFGGNNNVGNGTGHDNVNGGTGGDRITVGSSSLVGPGNNDQIYGGNNNGANGVGDDNHGTASGGDTINDTAGSGDYIHGGNLNAVGNPQGDDVGLGSVGVGDQLNSADLAGNDTVVADNQGDGGGSGAGDTITIDGGIDTFDLDND